MRRIFSRLCLFFIITLTTFLPLSADLNTQPLQIQVLNEENSIQPGKPFWLAVRFELENQWHTYWKNPGDAGMPAEIIWELPKGFEVTTVEWPAPIRFLVQSTMGFGYEKEATLLVKITPSSDLLSNGNAILGAKIHWVACSGDNCRPGNSEVKLTLPISEQIPTFNSQTLEVFLRARKNLPLKDWVASAERENNLVKLNLQMPISDQLFTSAYFCPEHEGTIDYKIEPNLSKSFETPDTYTFALQEVEGQTGKLQNLKGVLVLMNKDTGLTQAIDIAQPIKNSPINSEIAMADLPNNTNAIDIDAGDSVSEFKGQSGFVWALVFAFLGGMILNLMPCVLPVISLKILSFVKLAGQSRRETLKHGLAFAAGVIISFWILAIVLLVLQTYGESVGWGFQLQEPLFVAILAALIFTFSLSLFGVFEIGNSITTLAGQAQINNQSKSSALVGSFMSGILATALATPCTGPFLGPAIGFAVTLPALYSLTIFTFLGLGMAFPYLILAAFPSFLRYMPKPGAWMETFKVIMGFLMLATVLWLIWVFGVQTSTMALITLLVGFFLLAIGAWIFGKWTSPMCSKYTRWVAYALALGFAVMGTYVIFTSTASEASAVEPNKEIAYANIPHKRIEHWEAFSEKRLKALQALGVPVFIDFTAKWCLICQANHLVLSLEEVSNQLAEHGVIKMKADWTKNDPAITKMLHKFGRNGVPLYILYGKNPGDKPQILPQLLTPENISEALNKIKKPSTKP